MSTGTDTFPGFPVAVPVTVEPCRFGADVLAAWRAGAFVAWATFRGAEPPPVDASAIAAMAATAAVSAPMAARRRRWRWRRRRRSRARAARRVSIPSELMAGTV